METHGNATQASAAGASGVDRDKAAGWFQPNRTGLDRRLIIPPARACVFSPGSQISSFHTKLYEKQSASPVLRLFRSLGACVNMPAQAAVHISVNIASTCSSFDKYRCKYREAWAAAAMLMRQIPQT